jgi:polyhydroxyalkanoate synthase
MLHSPQIPAKTAARVVGAILRTPRPAARRLGRGLLRQLAVGLGRDEDDLPKLDRRFADPAWHGNPVLRRLAMSYLAWADAVNDVLTGTPLDWQTGSGPRCCSTTWSPPPRRPTCRS